jgi:hypothetical protein
VIVIPGRADDPRKARTDGANPESRHTEHVAGFRVHAKTPVPE